MPSRSSASGMPNPPLNRTAQQRRFALHPDRRSADIAIAPQLGTSVALLMGLWSGNSGQIVGTIYVRRRIAGEQQRENRGQAMRRRQTWIGVLVMIAVLLLISTVPGHADRGGHGYKGHAYRSHGHRGHWHRGHWHRGL